MIVPQIVGSGMGQPPGMATAPGGGRIAEATELLCRQLSTGENLLDALARVTVAFKPILSAEEQQAIVKPAQECAAKRTAPAQPTTFQVMKFIPPEQRGTTTTVVTPPPPTPAPPLPPTPTAPLPSALIEEQKRKERNKKIAIGVGVGVAGLATLVLLLR